MRRRFAESPTARSSELKQRISQRCLDQRSTPSDGRQHWNHWRETQAAIKTKCNAAVAQFDCSSAFNHADRTMILSHIRHVSPHLARSFYNILSHTTLNLVRKEDGSTMLVPSNDGLTQGCPASPTAFSFLILLVEEFFWSELVARAGEEAKAATDLFACLDDLTLVTEERFLEYSLWTSTGTRPNGARAVGVWDNVEDHEDFVLAGCLGTVDDQSSQAPTPIPVGNSSYFECFLQKRAEVTRGLSQHIQEITDRAAPPRSKDWRHDRSRSPDEGAEQLGPPDLGLGGFDERK